MHLTTGEHRQNHPLTNVFRETVRELCDLTPKALVSQAQVDSLGWLLFADKHGDGKFKFKDSDVSIVWYDSLTPSEDRAEMTPNVCYNFCPLCCQRLNARDAVL